MFERKECGWNHTIGGNPLAWFLAFWLFVPEFGAQLYGSVSEFAYYSMLLSPFCALVVAGLVVYVSGRREFWKRVDDFVCSPFVFVGVGLGLVMFGFLLSLVGYSSVLYYIGKSTVGGQCDKLLVSYSPSFLLFVLWIISGITLLTDGIRAVRLSKRTHRRLFCY